MQAAIASTSAFVRPATAVRVSLLLACRGLYPAHQPLRAL